MLNSTTLRLVLLVSCAHGLVHVYELALPSIEQSLETFYGCGKSVTGVLGNCWRLPWGMGAIVAGWLVDRIGARPMLTLFLLGCAAMCALVAIAPPLPILFAAMIGMGSFAAIYHPAGLTLISLETTPENRSQALGIHGIFGSLGIGFAPLLCGAMFHVGYDWRDYYWLLIVPGAVMGVVFAVGPQRYQSANTPSESAPEQVADQPARTHWLSFYILTAVGMLSGFTYSGFLQFLPRYFNGSGLSLAGIANAGVDQYLAGLVLVCGCIGQYLSGRYARHHLLERQLAVVIFLNVPFLLWMAVAQGFSRIWATCLFSVVHFSQQPLYNSLIAKYTPRHRRSLCYGFSFMMAFGVGGAGSSYAGFTTTNLGTYGGLAIAALAAALVCLTLVPRRQRSSMPP